MATVVLAAHLLAMNVAAAAPLVAIWLDRRAGKADTDAQAAVRKLMSACCLLTAIGALLGVLLGWLFWNDSYRELLGFFGYRVRWGVIEFVFSAIITGIYTVWVFWKPRVGTAAWLVRSFLAVLTATNLLYHFPPLFSLIAGAASGHFEITQVVDSRTFRHLMADGEVLALSTHFGIASLAVTGMLLAVLMLQRPEPATGNPIAVAGGRLALVSTVCQIPAGLWLMMQIPASDQRRLLGGDLLMAAMFITALMSTFWLLHLFAAIAFGDTRRKTIWRATAVLIAVVLLMTGTLRGGQRHEPDEQSTAYQYMSERNVVWPLQRISKARPSPILPLERLPKSL